ncbi:MAG: hypothetical protein IKT41_02060 [Clostridia bacterium]|nr:hypothetical protein [Clostridia bacterium]
MSLFTYGVITSLQKQFNGLGTENVKDGILIISKTKATLDEIIRKKYIADKNIIGYIKIGRKYLRFWAKKNIKQIAKEM